MNALAFLSGVLSLYQLSVIPPIWLGALIIPATVLFFTVPRAVLFTSFLLGFLIALGQSHWSLSQALPESLENAEIVVEGIVLNVPENRSRGSRFLFEIDTVETGEDRQAVRLLSRLNWYQFEQTVSAGERWRLVVRLRSPQGFLNPNSFDYETWLYQQGIRATGYVRESGSAIQLEEAPVLSLSRLRQLTWERLKQASPEGHSVSALVPALVLGIRHDIPQDQWSVFRATGTSHLMAISGLHVGLVATLAYSLGFLVWRLCMSCAVRFSAVKAGAVVSLFVAAVYAGMAGFSVPTQRALLMLAVLMVAILVGRSIKTGQGISVALVLVLLADTASVLSAGFWLSFLAVSLIFLVLSRWGERPVWQQFLIIQFAISLSFIPLTGWFFGEASLISPLANLFAVPLVTFVVVPLSLLASLLVWIWAPAAEILLSVTALVLELLIDVLSWIAEFPWSHIELPEISLWHLAVSAAAVIAFLIVRHAIRWVLPPLLVFSLFFSGRPQIGEGALQITFLDVGQGLSVVVETWRHVLVYDLGPRFSAYFNTAEAVVLPYLKGRGIQHVDRLFISHDDIDHRGALDEFLTEISVDEVVGGAEVTASRRPVSPCQAGEEWIWDSVQFEVLHPGEGWSGNDNDSSCVLKITTTSGASLLLTGDISKISERYLVEAAPEKLDASILQVPHHGSRSSSTSRFIDAVSPELAVYNLGISNRWGFPKEQVVERYRQKKVQQLRTDKAGAVIINFSPKSAEHQVTLWKDRVGRFWHRRQIAD